MRCNHDFRQMIAELICVHEGKIVLRDLVRQAFKPFKVNINQNSSKVFQQQTAKFPDFVDPDTNIQVIKGFETLDHESSKEEDIDRQKTVLQWSQPYVQEEESVEEISGTKQTESNPRPEMDLSDSDWSETTPF